MRFCIHGLLQQQAKVSLDHGIGRLGVKFEIQIKVTSILNFIQIWPTPARADKRQTALQ
jgi:hypothetical protein